MLLDKSWPQTVRTWKRPRDAGYNPTRLPVRLAELDHEASSYQIAARAGVAHWNAVGAARSSELLKESCWSGCRLRSISNAGGLWAGG